MRPTLASLVAAALVAGGLLVVPSSATAEPDPVPDRAATAQRLPAAPRAAGTGALAGRVIVIDAGHQLGNHNYPRQINRLVPAGGFKKPCNTTGTATDGGFPEATFTFRVTALLTTRLERAGATVILTRTANRQNLWGPCVDARGRAGNKADADLKISIHADGAYGGGPGFHVIAPTDRKRWTHDIFKPSRALAKKVRASLLRAGLPAAGYVAGGDGLDFRGDLATLNLSDVPTVMVESGNMRARADARRMTSKSGRLVYARALARAVRAYLA
ncbi:MAG: N-acetylmuramoyl-L-alanine amidase [Nocardioidaceae bacterium]